MLVYAFLATVLVQVAVAITFSAPRLLAGRFESKPNLGIAVWLISLALGLATSTAGFMLLLIAVIGSWLSLRAHVNGDQHSVSVHWIESISLTVSLWFLIGLAGIATFQVIVKRQNFLASSIASKAVLYPSLLKFMEFNKAYVYVAEVDALLAFNARIHSRQAIVISRGVIELLPESEINAVLWHEIGHISGRHNLIKWLTSWMLVLTPSLIATRELESCLSNLCELSADALALRRVSQADLNSAREKFLFS